MKDTLYFTPSTSGVPRPGRCSAPGPGSALPPPGCAMETSVSALVYKQHQTSLTCLFADCPDGEDEEDCPPEVEEKEDGEESSPEQSSSESSSSSSPDSSSSPRPVSAPRSCGRAEFQCRERHFCIHSAWLCDGDQDCPDGSDEVGAIEL